MNSGLYIDALNTSHQYKRYTIQTGSYPIRGDSFEGCLNKSWSFLIFMRDRFNEVNLVPKYKGNYPA